MIDIVLCTDENYVMPTGVLIYSILVTNAQKEITFHIVSAGISKKGQEMLSSLIKEKTKHIAFYTIDKEILKDCPIREEDHISLATYYRILFPTILPQSIDRVLYLDSDILCVDNIDSLWNTDISKYSAAVIIDIYNDDIRRYNRLQYEAFSGYFCGGVMLINLAYWREHDIQNKTLTFISQYPDRCIAHDQDALNYILKGTLLFVHPRYNVQLDFFAPYSTLFVDRKYFPSLTEATHNPCLLHFTGSEKPWHHECKYPTSLQNLWFEVARRTPWKDIKRSHHLSGKKLWKYRIKKFFAYFGFLNNPEVLKFEDEEAVASLYKRFSS